MSFISADNMRAIPIIHKFGLGMPCAFLRDMDDQEDKILDAEVQKIAQKAKELNDALPQKRMDVAKKIIIAVGSFAVIMSSIFLRIHHEVEGKSKKYSFKKDLKDCSKASAEITASATAVTYGILYLAGSIPCPEKELNIDDDRQIRLQRKIRLISQASRLTGGEVKDQLKTVSDAFAITLKNYTNAKDNYVAVEHHVTR